MYQRSKMQTRALDNLARYTEYYFKGQRVTKGFALSHALKDYMLHIGDQALLLESIEKSDVKDEGSGTPVNFNITQEANENLNDLKQKLDQITGRSLFPAQVIDILLLCATHKLDESNSSAVDKDCDLANDEVNNYDGVELLRRVNELAAKLIITGNTKKVMEFLKEA